MNKLTTEFLSAIGNEKADRILVNWVYDSMLDKLAKKRQDGRGGWYTASCKNKKLMQMVEDHIAKKDWIDVINLVAMIAAREELYGEENA